MILLGLPPASLYVAWRKAVVAGQTAGWLLRWVLGSFRHGKG